MAIAPITSAADKRSKAHRFTEHRNRNTDRSLSRSVGRTHDVESPGLLARKISHATAAGSLFRGRNRAFRSCHSLLLLAFSRFRFPLLLTAQGGLAFTRTCN